MAEEAAIEKYMKAFLTTDDHQCERRKRTIGKSQ
jgi:hypothetical protein